MVIRKEKKVALTGWIRKLSVIPNAVTHHQKAGGIIINSKTGWGWEPGRLFRLAPDRFASSR
ncbi:MAG: hypothetical protein JEZ06_15470 [Anaerolineaceae bacterium]|nr:hypothetical protein [Anaerolineaceae bacterium]